jgi:hypothetical protein
VNKTRRQYKYPYESKNKLTTAQNAANPVVLSTMNTPGTPSGPRSRDMANGAATLKTDHVAF